jgi:general L-amino acid transport system substrate-binding protein
MFKVIRVCCILTLLLTTLLAQAQQNQAGIKPGPTLNSVLSRGVVACGVNQDVRGFGYLDPNTGEMRGLEVDLCRALAAAIFEDATAAQLVPIAGDGGFAALENGEIDVLLHTVLWSLGNDARPRLDFGPVTFYSGQAIMVQTASNLRDWPDLDGGVICVVQDSAAAASLPHAMSSRGLQYQPLTLSSSVEAERAFTEGQCQAYSANLIELEAARQRTSDPTAYMVWQGRDHIYTQEPLAAVYRNDDPQWKDIVDWTLIGLVEAEQLGISSENVNTLVRQPDEDNETYTARVGLDVARFLDLSLGVAAPLALSSNFMLSVIRETGNYGEIYSRHLGAGGDIVIERGLNALWRNGGLMSAPAWR